MDQCKKLIQLSDSIETWSASLYGSFLKFSTEHTLVELRRHWKLYIDMHGLPKHRLAAINEAFVKRSQLSINNYSMYLCSIRSSGPLVARALRVVVEQYQTYWKTGVTHSDPLEIKQATFFNPAFAYSLGGEGFHVQNNTDPLVPFHLSALFGNAQHTTSVSHAVKYAKAEFCRWCLAFYSKMFSGSSNRPIIRLFLGEATAVCRALVKFCTASALESNIPASLWDLKTINLAEEYKSGTAPSMFNVIETSNLQDHIGLLNVLISVVPLISLSSRATVLYTESLLFYSDNPTKEVQDNLYSSITVMGLILDICPVDYLSGFTSRSNTHELLLQNVQKTDAPQFHQVMTWKSPSSGDALAHVGGPPALPTFDSNQMGTLLYDMYQILFIKTIPKTREEVIKALPSSNLVHHIHETFVLLLRVVKDRLAVKEMWWSEVMDRFFRLKEADKTLPMDQLNYQDFCSLLHQHGVLALPPLTTELARLQKFLGWTTVTPLSRIFLSIPRDKVDMLSKSAEQNTPLLHGEIRGINDALSIFTSVRAAFGTINSSSGSQITIEEDKEKMNRSSPLLLSFVIPTRLLLLSGLEKITVGLAVWNTLAGVLLASNLGINLNVFKASLMDRSHVYIIPEHIPLSPPPQIFPRDPGSFLGKIGKSEPAVVEMDDECENVVSMTMRLSVASEGAKKLFESKANPHISQLSPCVINVSLGVYSQNLRFPFPVIGREFKARLARKSQYIEVSTFNYHSGPYELT